MLPDTADSIFCVIEVSTCVGLLGPEANWSVAGGSTSPFPDRVAILSCRWPCVCAAAISPTA